MAAITEPVAHGPDSVGAAVPEWVLTAFAASSLATAVAGDDQVVVWANRALLALLGRTAEDLLGQPLAELAHPAERVRVQARASEVLGSTPYPPTPLPDGASGGPIRVQGRAPEHWLELTLTEIPRSADAAGGLLIHLVDVSHEVQAVHSLQVMADNTLDLVVLLDTRGLVAWASPSVRTVLGHDPEALVGRELSALAASEDRYALSDALAGAGAGAGTGPEAVVRTVRFRSTTGAYRYLSVSARPAEAAGFGELTAVALRDITEELRAKRELARSEEQFRMAMLGAPEGMAVTDSQDRIVQVNPALCELLGTNAASLIGHRFREFIPVEEREQVDRWRERLLRGNVSIERCQHRLTSATNEVWVDHSVGMMSDDQGNPQVFVHQFADRTAAHRLQADLAYKASHDVATGLANKESLQTRLNQRLGHPPESAGLVGLMFADIDNLKPTNDRFGHLVGDAVIAAVASRMERAVRRKDVVARVGGDEFVIVLDHCSSVEELALVAGNVHSAASHPLDTSAGPVDIAISVGAVLAEATAGTDEALARADAALYRAKRSGGNRICVEGLSD